MNFNFNITEHIDTISETKAGEYTLELNKISWNGRESKLDLRRWHNTVDGRTPQKGLTLNEWEVEALKTVLNEKCQ